MVVKAGKVRTGGPVTLLRDPLQMVQIPDYDIPARLLPPQLIRFSSLAQKGL
jgi:hypothetical protein